LLSGKFASGSTIQTITIPTLENLKTKTNTNEIAAKGEMMDKYAKLTEWLRRPIVLTFDEIEKIIGEKLPDAALKYRPWWGNEKGAKSRQCKAWLDAGWEVGKVDLKSKMVLFRRAQTP
jgi:hypothetical protein